MYVIRPITQNDAEAFVKIAFQAGIGMTSMPKNREILLGKVGKAVESFRKNVDQPGTENYLFVLEDLELEVIAGASGIEAKTGCSNPLFFYRIEEVEIPSIISSKPAKKIHQLRVVHYYDAPTEICSLYLLPKYRHEGLGRLLSLSRFLFIAAHLQRFDQMIFAEMRGFIEKNNSNPFWEGVARHFIDMEFQTLMHIRDEDFIDFSKALPSSPIYIPLLSKEIQESIGKVHHDTVPALNMLIQEGFILSDEIDVFDGGPKIGAEIQEIRTIKTSRIAVLSKIVEAHDHGSKKYLASNEKLDFRAGYATIEEVGNREISLTAEVSAALKLKMGDPVRYVEIAHG